MSEKNIHQIEQKLSAVKTNLKSVAQDEVYDQLLVIIHRPGWTTLAESAFFETVVDSMEAHVRSLSKLQRDLLRASELVGAHAETAGSRA
jgi:hypothetical protein